MPSGYEQHSLDSVEEFLDDNPSAEPADVYFGTINLDARAVAAVAASRGGGGGGAALPDEWTVGEDGALLIEAEGVSAQQVLGVANDNASTPLLRLQGFNAGPGIGRGEVDVGGRGDVSISTVGNVVGLLIQKLDGDTGQPLLQIFDADFNECFRVDADGSVHIPTGATIQADL